MTDPGHLDDCDLSVVGHVVTASEDHKRWEVRITNGLITWTGPLSNRPFVERLDVGESLVLPGLVDAHVHSLSHSSEGIPAATRSAAAGGVTTIVEMPFDGDGPIWDIERLSVKKEKVDNQAVVDVGLYGTVRPGDGLDQIPRLAENGVVGFKVSTFNTDVNRFPGLSTDYLLKVFEIIATTDLPVVVHSEDNEIVQASLRRARDSGRNDAGLHTEARPAIAEYLAVAKVLELARWTGVRVHLAHLSTCRAVDMVTAAKEDGVKATSETCPHYLTFTEQNIVDREAYLKINPPLRSAEEREGLWERVADGSIDVISSDHAPWPRELKTKNEFLDNHSGAPGVETLWPIVMSGAQSRGVSLQTLIKVMAKKPSEIFGISHRKGDLKPGLDADLVIVDPTRRNVIDEAILHSNAGWSPYDGMEVLGQPSITISRGATVWDGVDLHVSDGRGELVTPSG